MVIFLLAIVAFFGVLYLIPRLRNEREIARKRDEFARVGDCFPILVPTCDRPEDLAQMFEAFGKMRGADETTIIVSQDERHPEIARLIRELPLDKIHLEHTQPFFAFFSRIGLITRAHCIGSHIFFLIDKTFRNTDVKGVIVLEEDLVPSPNFYEFYKWCFDRVLLDPELGKTALTCGAYNIFSKGNIPLSECYKLFSKDAHFSPWGWAISRERWEQIRKDWSFTSFDGNMESRIMPKYGLLNYSPYISHVDCVGNFGVNISLPADNRFHRTYLHPEPIDFAASGPEITPSLPDEYKKEQAKYQRVKDPDYKSEWDRKLVPMAWEFIRGNLLSGDLYDRLRKRLPFL